MKERIKFVLFLFLISLSFYVLRVILINARFKPVKLAPAVSYFPAPYGKIIASDGEPLLFSTLYYDVYLDLKYAKVLSNLKGWSYRDMVDDTLKYFGISVNSKIAKKIKDATGGVEIGVVSGEKLSELPKKYRSFLNVRDVYKISSLPTPTRIIVRAISKEYEVFLKPKKDGKVVYAKFGPYKLYSKIKKMVNPIGGDTLLSTIDPRIQAYAFELAKAEKISNDASGVQIVVTNPQTGAILAMASTYPWNAPVMNVFEPGSTVKPLVFAAALQSGVVSTCTTFSTPFFIPSPQVPLVIRDAETHPWPIDLRQALVYSSDVAEMNIAKRFILKKGKDGFYSWFLKFGFGKKTGIDLPDEVNGLLPKPREWYSLGGLEMSIGQGMAVTAIQLVTALNSIANGGFVERPHVANEVISPSGSVVYHFSADEREIFDSKIARVIKDFMVDVVRYGTGKKAQIPGVTVAGKTGTAQKPLNGKISRKGPFFSLFYGFFPAYDPIYSILVVVDQPSNGKYYGGDVAAPIFKKMGEYVLKVKGDENRLKSRKRVFLPTVFPNLEGLTLNESLKLLEELSIPSSRINFYGNGVVKSQFPLPNTPILKVKHVKIYLSPSF